MSGAVRDAQVGTWRYIQDYGYGYYGTYSNLQPHSGSMSFRQNWGSSARQANGMGWASPTISNPSTSFYISFWMFLPSAQDVPGTNNPDGPNWKEWWLSANDVFASDFGFQTITNSLPGEMDFGWIDGSMDRASAGYRSCPFTKGRWARFDVYIVGSTTSSGAIKSWFTDPSKARYLWSSANGKTLDSANATGWKYLHFPGYGRYDTNSNTYYDDIYVATGPGAQARVEIGNQPTYAACTNLAVATVSSWSSTSITATVRSGSFSSGSAYLYVIDSDGVANTNGYPITLGQAVTPTTDTTPPANPNGVTVDVVQ